MSRIRLLPENVINKIAAGELVERPASVVKELVENACDAGATRIEVNLLDGGKRAISVRDDGCGMDRDDALLALERHATSKIAAFEDLDRVTTLGFRGEALPSIAAVSRLTLTTWDGVGEAGTSIVAAGGRVAQVRPAAHQRGTTVDVRDLFFATPARRKFMRSTETELQHSALAVEAYALGRWELSMALAHGDTSLLDVPPARSARERVLQVFGAAWDGDLAAVEWEGPGLRLAGLVAKRERWFTGRRHQFFFVNRRLVRDRVLAHAFSQALAETVRDGARAPALFLWLEIDPELVDVNVHPAKTEVRFRHSSQVHDAVRDAVVAVLGRGGGGVPVAVPQSSANGAPAITTDGHWPAEPRPSTIAEGGAAFDAAIAAARPLFPPLQSAGSPSGSAPVAREGAVIAGWRYLGQLQDSYLIVEGSDGLWLLDQHAAHERVLFERYRQALDARAVAVQRLLVPALLPFSPAERRALAARAGELAALGFEIAEVSGGDVALVAAPALLDAAGAANALSELAAGLRESPSGEAGETWTRAVAASVACHAAIKVHRALRPEEALRLLADWMGCGDPHHCPHGRPVALTLGMAQLERHFLRR